MKYDWIEITEDNLPSVLRIVEWMYKDNPMCTEIGSLVDYHGPHGEFTGWFVYPEDSSADIYIGDFSHYRFIN